MDCRLRSLGRQTHTTLRRLVAALLETPLLPTAELLVGMSRHLSTYGDSQPKADLAQLRLAGRIFELALRLRGSGVSSPERVEALGVNAGISKRDIRREFLPMLEVLGLVDLERDQEGAIKVVSEPGSTG